MKKTKLTRSLLAACSIVALTAVMYGCVHSGDEVRTVTEEVEVEVPVVDPTTALFTRAQDAKDQADGAGMTASGAVDTAKEAAGGLTTMEVAGDSGMAMANAAAILKAKDDVAQALMDAEAAETEANAVETAAEDVPEDNPNLMALMGLIEDAIKAAEDAVMTAENSRDDDDLAAAVDEVTGGDDADPQGTPRDVANEVGMDIAMALLPTGTGGGTRVTAGTTAPEDTIADELKVELHDRTGMTWKDIVGATMKMRIATSATDTNEVYVSSVKGMTLTSTATVTEADAFADDGLQAGATYKGIEGTIICAGADCTVTENAVETGDRDLGGSWYFTPSDPDEYWVKDAAGTGYTEDTLFTAYGHWLSPNTTDPTLWDVDVFATSAGGTDYALNVAAADADALTDTEAKYSGMAAGMSVLKMDNAAGDGQDIDSGRFTAEVNLTAMFGGSPTVSGTINGFKGTAVNEDWTVSLESATLAGGGTPTADIRTVTTGADGIWSNAAYGSDAGARPTGIFGSFTAHFSDGHAAGAYATRKSD